MPTALPEGLALPNQDGQTVRLARMLGEGEGEGTVLLSFRGHW